MEKVLFILTAFLAAHANAQTRSLKDLGRYYFSESQGTIHIAKKNGRTLDRLFSPDILQFSLDQNDWSMVAQPNLAVESAQKLFEFDIELYRSQFPGKDFLESKFLQASRTDYNQKSLRFIWKYPPLQEWGQLPHPPIQNLSFPKGFYYHPFSDETKIFLSDHPFFNPDFQKDIDQESGSELTSGNVIRYLPNNESFPEKLRIIRDARKYVFISALALICDEAGDSLQTEIRRKITAKIPVLIIVDQSNLFLDSVYGQCLAKLKEMGTTVVFAEKTSLKSMYEDSVDWVLKIKNPLSAAPDVLQKLGDVYNNFDKYYSNYHQKVIISDGKVAILGGQNLVEANTASTGVNFHNRDSDALVTGPVVTDLVLIFYRTFLKFSPSPSKEIFQMISSEIKNSTQQENSNHMRGSAEYREWLTNPAKRMNGLCRVVVQDSDSSPQRLTKVLYKLLRAAKAHVLLTTPNFDMSDPDNLPDAKTWGDIFFDLVEKKAAAGATIDFITSGLVDNSGEGSVKMRRFQNWLQSKNYKHSSRWLRDFRSFNDHRRYSGQRWKHLRLANMLNVRVLEYFNYSHQKIAYFDRIIASISSFNLNAWSMDRGAQELALICQDKNLNDSLENALTRDISNSIPVLPSRK